MHRSKTIVPTRPLIATTATRVVVAMVVDAYDHALNHGTNQQDREKVLATLSRGTEPVLLFWNAERQSRDT